MSVAGGQVPRDQADGGPATLTGTARYSLVRPRCTEQATGSGTTIGYHCPVPIGDCELDMTINAPAGCPSRPISTDGGDASVTGMTSQVKLSTGGGNISADHVGPAPPR